ncbi:MAG: phosphatidylglycerophosphatase A [Deferribacterales bacterium]
MDRFLKFYAVGFGSGLTKFAPGTFGTVFAVLLTALTGTLPYWAKALIFLVLLVGGVKAADRYEQLTGKKDASEVVIDEIAAYYMIFLFYPVNIVSLLIGFVLFRIFDITKPYPIKKLEKIEGGLGVMLDDLLAAVYSMIVMILLYGGYALLYSHI